MSRAFFQRLLKKPGFVPAALLFLLASGCGKNTGTSDTATVVQPARAVTPSSALAVIDLAGRTLDPFDAPAAKAIVFIFISSDCPISNRYAPEIRRVAEEFHRAGAALWLVYADADTSPDAIETHLKEYQLPLKVLRDPQHALVRLSQVHVTPEAAVFLPGRRLVYHGRIDNRYAALGKERPEATQRDLRNVLEAVLQGKPAPYSTAPAVGCYIPDPK